MSKSATSRHAQPARREGMRETIEPIVIALILAFVFRAFVVEAFVIPTGSMAPTLYGAHGTIVCEDCGMEFAYGLRDIQDHRAAPRVAFSARAVCPNCNHGNSDLAINDVRQNPETGDRILVLKWPYDVGGELFGPSRWDIVVFKDPADGETNFIKRLVGLPGEVLMIVDGDIYHVPVTELSEETLAQLDELRHQKYLLRSEQQQGRLPATPPGALRELDEKLRIARKSPEAQMAMWFGAYDHDYPPRTLDPGQPYWLPANAESSGWDATSRRIIFEDAGVDEDFIELKGKGIVARCAYNIHARGFPPTVSDLRVRFVLTPRTQNGAVSVWLGKMGRSFVATLDMDGSASIIEPREGQDYDGRIELSTLLPPLVPGKSVEMSFENVDYRLSLRVGGREVLATSGNPAEQSFYGPDISRLRILKTSWPGTAPRIYGKDGIFELKHLAVDRDAYYYHDSHSRALGLSWAPGRGWASSQSPILLREDEFFMLGDNTSASKDSRLWDKVDARFAARGEGFQLGTVPRDQLIGKAFFVYWPGPNSVSWLEWLPVFKGHIVPDVGRMRWIR